MIASSLAASSLSFAGPLSLRSAQRSVVMPKSGRVVYFMLN